MIKLFLTIIITSLFLLIIALVAMWPFICIWFLINIFRSDLSLVFKVIATIAVFGYLFVWVETISQIITKIIDRENE